MTLTLPDADPRSRRFRFDWSESKSLAVTVWINQLCHRLSAVALGIVFFYSLTKRFTSRRHFLLGLALSVSPVGAWLAVGGDAFVGVVFGLGIIADQVLLHGA